MSFKLWSLDFIYYPVSGIMWVWHKIFGFFFGDASPWAWVLSVIFLVFTLRGVLFKPFMKQMDSQLKMQAIQPEMKRIRAKYKDDRQRLTEEMMKLNKEAGVNPLASCLPMLLQAPAFIGLFRVIRHFQNSFGDGTNVTNNYFFPASDVKSFNDALLFDGASLSGHLLTFSNGSFGLATEKLHALGGDLSTQLAVAVPLMIIAAVATHMTSRKSVARQKQMGTAAQGGGQMAIMQKLMLYVFPLAVLGIGWFYPLALLFYWLANNSWTFGQLWVAHRIQDRKLAEESKVVEAAKDAKTYSKPQPGARPTTPRPGAKPRPGTKPQAGARPASGKKSGSAGGNRTTAGSGGKQGGAIKPSPVDRSAGANSAPAQSGSVKSGSAQSRSAKSSSGRPAGSKAGAKAGSKAGSKSAGAKKKR